MRRPLSLLVLVLVLPSVLAGCGGNGDTNQANSYVAAVNRSERTFGDAVARLQGQFTTSSTPDQDRMTLGDMKKAVDDAVRELGAISPPDKVGQLHSDLVNALTDYGKAISRARKELTGGDPKSVIAARTTLSTAGGQAATRIQRAAEGINAALHS